MIAFELPGEPRGKGRPRSRVAWTKGDKPFVAVYTDAETRAYERALALAAKVAMRGKEPMGGPLRAFVAAYMSVPGSWSNSKRDAALVGKIRPMGRPDVDNMLKVIDALNKIVWTDDSVVVDVRVAKFYSERPRLVIKVFALDEGNERTDFGGLC